eukprot:2298315-Pleurochrysis_carterae.AAC.3
MQVQDSRVTLRYQARTSWIEHPDERCSISANSGTERCPATLPSATRSESQLPCTASGHQAAALLCCACRKISRQRNWRETSGGDEGKHTLCLVIRVRSGAVVARKVALRAAPALPAHTVNGERQAGRGQSARGAEACCREVVGESRLLLCIQKRVAMQATTSASTSNRQEEDELVSDEGEEGGSSALADADMLLKQMRDLRTTIERENNSLAQKQQFQETDDRARHEKLLEKQKLIFSEVQNGTEPTAEADSDAARRLEQQRKSTPKSSAPKSTLKGDGAETPSAGSSASAAEGSPSQPSQSRTGASGTRDVRRVPPSSGTGRVKLKKQAANTGPGAGDADLNRPRFDRPL